MKRPSGVVEAPRTPVLVRAEVSPACRSRRKRFSVPVNEPAAKSVALLRNRTYLPPPITLEEYEALVPGPVPLRFQLTSAVVEACKSRMKTSSFLLLSPGTKLSALLVKTTYRPSELIAGSLERPSAEKPLVATLTRTFVPSKKSRTKISRKPLVSLAARLSASLDNTTCRPLLVTEKGDITLGPLGLAEGKA